MEEPQGQSEQLSRVIAFDTTDRAIWPAQELRTALRRQMGARLTHVFPGPNRGEIASVLASLATPPIQTFADLLSHPRPPMDLLWMVKDLSKRARDSESIDPPPDVALLLYYASIILAMLRHAERISTLSDEELRHGFNWAVRQPWIDAELRDLFLDGLRFLRSARHRWRR